MRVYTPIKKPKRKKWPWLIPSCIILVCATYITMVLSWPLQAVGAQPVTYSAQTAQPPVISWPAYGQAAIGAEGYDVLSSSNATAAPVPIASITKIITTLTVLEVKPIETGQPGPTITFTAADAALYNQYIAKDGVVARADAGLQLTEYQVLQGMLISSANNYADSLAIWGYGSMDAYLAAAKTYLAQHGLTQTQVLDASGFSPGSKSTAQDLTRLGLLALKNPVIKDIVSQKSAVIPGVGTLQNTNILLGTNNIIGIKTGTTDEAGACLLFAATYQVANNTITIVGALLGAPGHVPLFRDVTTLLESAKKGFQTTVVAKSSQTFGTYKAPWGATTSAVLANDVSLVTWGTPQTTVNTSLQKLEPSDTNSQAGTVTFVSGKAATKARLATNRPLASPTWQWRLTHPQDIF